MAENRASGPKQAQTVIYTASGVSIPALVISVDKTTGLVRLTTFPAGGTTADQQNVSYDNTRTVSGTWSYPDGQTGI